MCEYHKGTEAMSEADRLRQMLKNWIYRNCWSVSPLGKYSVWSIKDSLTELLDCYDSMSEQLEEFRAEIKEQIVAEA
jgi:hypothetical protein